MNSLPFHVRQADANDAWGIAEVHVASWRVTYVGIMPDELLNDLSVEERASHWRDLIQKKESELYVAIQGEHVVGFVFCLLKETGDEAELVALYVRPGQEGRGIGYSLFGAAKAALISRHCIAVELWVAVENHSAQGFYRRQGMDLSGRRKTLQFRGKSVETVGYRLQWARPSSEA